MKITVEFNLNKEETERMENFVELFNRVRKSEGNDKEIEIETAFQAMILAGSKLEIDKKLSYWEEQYLRRAREHDLLTSDKQEVVPGK